MVTVEGEELEGEDGVVALTDEEIEKNNRLEREKDVPARWAALPVAVIILMAVFGYLVFQSSACMCGTWCNLGAKEATV